MKAYLCVAGILSAFLFVQCEIPAEIKSKLDECLKELELSKESLKSPDFEDPKVKCLSACFLKKDNRMTEGKLSIDREVDEALKYVAKEKIDDSFKDKITECVNKANEEKDNCGVGSAMYKCVIENFGPLSFEIEE